MRRLKQFGKCVWHTDIEALYVKFAPQQRSYFFAKIRRIDVEAVHWEELAKPLFDFSERKVFF